MDSTEHLLEQLDRLCERETNGDLKQYWPVNARTGPKLPIPTIRLSSLLSLKQDDGKPDNTLHTLAFELMRGTTVVDHSADPKSLTGTEPGAMRSWHQNDSLFLPTRRIDPDTLQNKALRYHQYIERNKGLMNKQRAKGVAQVYTGYVEFTAGGWTNYKQD
ncbi:MAG TPA: hypothetical protein VI299_10255 [Polyangiales bacterium]